jgi:hypothetical protein
LAFTATLQTSPSHAVSLTVAGAPTSTGAPLHENCLLLSLSHARPAPVQRASAADTFPPSAKPATVVGGCPVAFKGSGAVTAGLGGELEYLSGGSDAVSSR